MKKLLAITAAVILMGGAVAAIVWACCGQSTFPLDVINIAVAPDPIPCGYDGDVTISFDVVVGQIGWPDPGYELDKDTYADVIVGGNLVATVPATPPAAGWGMAGTYSASVTVAAPAGTSSVMIVAYNGEVISVPGPDIVMEPCYEVDIKGGSCPNSVNTKSKGVLPVAILGEMEDLEALDPDSIMVGGVQVIPGMSIFEDSTAPNPGTGDPAICEDCFDGDDPANFNCDTDGDGVDDAFCGDGMMELVVYVDMQALAAGPLAGAARDDCIELLVVGTNVDGNSVEIGSDSVRIVK